MSLKIATKAPQAATFPVLLVAQFAKEKAKANIDIKFEEVETLDAKSKASVVFSDGSNDAISGSKDVLSKLAASSSEPSSQKQVGVVHIFT